MEVAPLYMRTVHTDAGAIGRGGWLQGEGVASEAARGFLSTWERTQSSTYRELRRRFLQGVALVSSVRSGLQGSIIH